MWSLVTELVNQIQELQAQNKKLQEQIQQIQQTEIFDNTNWRQWPALNYIEFLKAQEKPFLVEFINIQCRIGLAPGSRQWRWPENMLWFWKIVHHQPSERKVIDYLTGAGNFGKKTDNNSNNNFNLHVPSNHTLDNLEGSGYYGTPPENKIIEIKTKAQDYALNVNGVWFIITFDGIKTRPEHEYDHHMGLVIGGEKAYTPEEFLNTSTTDISYNNTICVVFSLIVNS